MVSTDFSGTTLDGRYRLVSLLGAGGMGQVYEGAHLSLDRRVAIKILPSQLSEDDRFRARFAREARAVAKIPHRNVVQIMDFGESPDGPVYFVMEFLDGRDLGALLRAEGRLAWPRARHLLLQAVSALKAAHAHGIIHRDIKPGNCFVIDLPHEGLTDVVKLLDFGIAKVLTEVESEGGALIKPLTGTGEIMGTASYMAPEQARCERMDARSDVYSLGIMAYEMLTGRVPFVGVNPFYVVTRHLHDRPDPLHRLVPDILPDVEAIVLRAIAKEPEERFQSMAELEAAMMAVADVSIDSIPTLVRSAAGSAERVERGRNVPTIGLRVADGTPEPRVLEDSFEDAETPDPLVLMPRFGEPLQLRAGADRESSDPALSTDDEPGDPLVEALPTRVRLITNPAETSSNAPPDAGTMVEVGSFTRGPEPPPAPDAIDELKAAPVQARPEVVPIPEWREVDELGPGASHDVSSTPARSGRRSRLLGLVVLVASAVGIAAATMTDDPEERAAADARMEAVERNEPGAQVGQPMETAEPSTTDAADPRAPERNVEDAGVAALPEQEPIANEGTASPDGANADGTRTPVVNKEPEAPEARDGAPLRRRRSYPTYETSECDEHRYEADVAHRAGIFGDVVDLASRRSCWSPAQQLERQRMLQNALLKLGRYSECLALGSGSGEADPEMVQMTKACRKISIDTLRHGAKGATPRGR